jgi:hypothetical protein
MTILIIIAVILWFLAAIPFPWASPIQLGWLGLFFFGLSILIK